MTLYTLKGRTDTGSKRYAQINRDLEIPEEDYKIDRCLFNRLLFKTEDEASIFAKHYSSRKDNDCNWTVEKYDPKIKFYLKELEDSTSNIDLQRKDSQEFGTYYYFKINKSKRAY